MVAMRCEDARFQMAVLTELDDEERYEAQAHLSSCAQCRAEKTAIDTSLQLLQQHAVTGPPQHTRASVLGVIEMAELAPALEHAAAPPPSRLKTSVMQVIEDERRGSSQSTVVVPISSRRGRFARSIGVAATLLILGAGIGWIIGANDDAPPRVAVGPEMPEGHETQTLPLDGMGPDQLEVRHFRHDNFRLTLSVEGFEPTPAGFHYAVWARGDAGDIALGTFRLKREDSFDIPFAMGVNPSDFPDIVITLEPNLGEAALEGEIITEGSFDLATVYHGTYED